MRKILFILIIVTTSLSAKSQSFGDWTKGCYYDTTGKKICGLIKWEIPSMMRLASGDNIVFKDSLKGARRKIHTDQFKSFVVNGDSLVVSQYADFENSPILLVAIDNPLKLYKHFEMSNNINNMARLTDYYFGPDADIVTELVRSKFIEVMSQIVADDTELVTAIKNKSYRYGDMDDVIKKYKEFRKSKDAASQKQ